MHELANFIELRSTDKYKILTIIIFTSVEVCNLIRGRVQKNVLYDS